MFGRPVEPFGRETAQRNVDLVEGKEVELEPDTADVNAAGFLLRYVYVDDVMVNEVLLREGLARLAPPDWNTRYEALLRGAEERARAAPVNIWTLVTPTPTTTPTPTQTPTLTPTSTPLRAPIVLSPRVLLPFATTPTPTPRPQATVRRP
jgi:micrococcal nuclease